jgi:hypothetical protein
MGKRNEFVFYNRETGKPFVDLKAGFGCMQEGRNRRCNVAYVAAHFRFQALGTRSGYSDSPAVARAFDGHRNDALHAHKS